MQILMMPQLRLSTAKAQGLASDLCAGLGQMLHTAALPAVNPSGAAVGLPKKHTLWGWFRKGSMQGKLATRHSIPWLLYLNEAVRPSRVLIIFKIIINGRIRFSQMKSESDLVSE